MQLSKAATTPFANSIPTFTAQQLRPRPSYGMPSRWAQCRYEPSLGPKLSPQWLKSCFHRRLPAHSVTHTSVPYRSTERQYMSDIEVRNRAKTSKFLVKSSSEAGTIETRLMQ